MNSKKFFEDANDGIPRDVPTIFDKKDYNVKLQPELKGESLRRRLTTITCLQDNISRLTNHFALQAALCEINRKRAKYIAYTALKTNEDYKKANLEDKKMMLESYVVKIEETETTAIDEEEKAAIFNLLANRGKDKLRELLSNLDLGRSMFSWDKGAIGKGIS